MKYLIVLCMFAALAIAAPVVKREVVPLLRYEKTQDEFGQYTLYYLTGDGTLVDEKGSLKAGPEGNVLVRSGMVSWTSPEGIAFSLSYYADETGYHASLIKTN